MFVISIFSGDKFIKKRFIMSFLILFKNNLKIMDKFQKTEKKT